MAMTCSRTPPLSNATSPAFTFPLLLSLLQLGPVYDKREVLDHFTPIKRELTQFRPNREHTGEQLVGRRIAVPKDFWPKNLLPPDQDEIVW